MLSKLKNLIDQLLPALLLAALGALWAIAIGILCGPALLDWIEAGRGATLTYEESIRAFLLSILAVFLLVWTLRLIGRVTVARLVTYGAVLLGSAAVTFVAVFDTDEDHPLGEEFSWIRYATALFLLATAAVGAAIARSYARQGGARAHTRLWIVLAIGFVVLACDEIFMGHEAIGDFLLARGFGHLATDVVTTSYAFVALGLVLFLATQRAYLKEYVVGHTVFVALFVGATLVFLTGQIGDTLDIWTHQKLLEVAAARAAEGHFFSDFWYPMWGPKRFMNDAEEVFECIASALFCASFLMLLIERRAPDSRTRVLFAAPGLSRALLIVAVTGFSIAAMWLARGRSIDSPVEGRSAVLRVGPQHGLFHSDHVFHHPNWGLLIANEGGDNIVTYRDGVVDSLPDPGDQVSDTDGVTANDNAVYVATPSLDTIWEYTREGGYRPLITRDDGLLSPEGLIVVDSMLYVADETHYRLYAIDLRTRSVVPWPLEDQRFARPEGIAYHPGIDRVMFTDDVWGSIARVDRDGNAELLAYYTDGFVSPEDLCITSDGRIFVADNGRREVIEISADGTVVQRIRFHRMHSYLVGVAVVEATEAGAKDKLYVVLSDGYESLSFMPSVMWEMDLPDPPAP